jgi:WD40 repeat protein/Tfp pilus assembly protein PilF
LSAFVLGTLPETSLERIARHLDVCSECEARVQSLDQLSDPLIEGLQRRPTGSASGSGSLRASGVVRGVFAAPMPERLGDYRILRELGRGGMGVVYEAEQVSLGRHVALKVLPLHSVLSRDAVERFRREARAAARLHHTNIVQVFGTGEQDGLRYYVMQLIPGAGLDAIVGELKRQRQGAETPRTRDVSLGAAVAGLLCGRFAAAGSGSDAAGSSPPAPASATPPLQGSAQQVAAAPGQLAERQVAQAAGNEPVVAARAGRTYWTSVTRIGIQVAEALAYAHAQGIVHRDVKPSNLLLDPQGQVWVADFGLAKEATGPDDLTHSGFLIGTLRYVPPERFGGQSDARGDIYGLGLALYELLTLRPAFPETDRNALLNQVMHSEPPRPRRLEPGVPYDLETIVLKAIARNPDHRYQTAAELGDDLRRFVEDRPIRARRVSVLERLGRWARRNPGMACMIAALLLVLAVGFASVFVLWQRAEHKADDEARARRRAEVAEADAADNLYFSQIAQARLEWRLNNVVGADLLLDRCVPARRGWEWYYLRGVNRSELATLSNPGQAFVTAVAFSRGHPGAKSESILAFTGCNPYDPSYHEKTTEVELWNPDTGRRLRTLPAPPDSPSLTFSPDGKLLAVDNLQQAQLWDVATGELLRSWEPGGALSFSPDGKLLAAGSAAGITIWDASSGATVRRFSAQNGRVTFSPDGRVLAVSSPGEIELRDAGTGDAIGRLVYNAGGRRVEVDRHFIRGGGPEAAFSPDGKLLIVATTPPQLWEVRTCKLLHNLTGHAGIVPGVAFSPDGRRVATAATDSTVRLWDVQSGQEVLILRGHARRVGCVAFHPGGWCLASGGRDPGEVKLWDLTRQPEYLVEFDPSSQALLFDPEKAGVLHSITIQGRLETREVESGVIHPGARLDLTQQWITPASLADFSGDGRQIALASGDPKTVKVCDTRSGRETAALKGLPSHPAQVVFSRDGRRVAGLSWPWRDPLGARAVQVWDVSGTPLASFTPNRGSDGFHGAVALSPDGARVAFDDYPAEGTAEEKLAGARVRVCDAADGREIRSLPAPDGLVQTLAFSQDGRLLAAGRVNQSVLIWDETGRPLHERPLDGPTGRLAFSPDGRRLAGADREEVKVWAVRSGDEVLTLRGSPRPGDNGFNQVLAWSPDGRWLAAMCWTGWVSVWDAAPVVEQRAQQTAASDRAAPGPGSGAGRVPAARVFGWHLDEADYAFQAHQVAAAHFHLQRVKSAAGGNPPDTSRRLRRAHLFARFGEWDQALADYAEAFAGFDPDRGEFWHDYARLLLRQGDVAGYRKLRQRMLAHFARMSTLFDPLPKLGRVATLGAGLEPAESADLKKKPLVQDKDRPDQIFTLGLVHLRAGEWDQALARLGQAIDMDPGSDWVKWPALALAHEGQGHREEAKRWLDKAAAWRTQWERRRAEDPFAICAAPEWLDFEILYAEAAGLLADPKPEEK